MFFFLPWALIGGVDHHCLICCRRQPIEKMRHSITYFLCFIPGYQICRWDDDLLSFGVGLGSIVFLTGNRSTTTQWSTVNYAGQTELRRRSVRILKRPRKIPRLIECGGTIIHPLYLDAILNIKKDYHLLKTWKTDQLNWHYVTIKKYYHKNRS